MHRESSIEWPWMMATCPDHDTRTSNYLPISPAVRRDKHPIRGMAVMLSLGQEGSSGSLIGANRKMQTAQVQKSVHHERVLHCSTTSSALCNAEERTQSSASLCNFNNLSAYDDKGTICPWKMSSMFPCYIYPSIIIITPLQGNKASTHDFISQMAAHPQVSLSVYRPYK